MIWLASYPRSGNTFFRIVLSEVYGLESSTYHHESDYPVDADYPSFPVVKTHLLPHQLEPSDPSIPAVYLVRDGRDCAVSMAHYRKDLIESQSVLDENLRAVIEAEEGSHFGGWSHHVESWSERAAIVIRFADLIVDPIGQIERLREIIDLPKPNLERLPSFADLRSRSFAYGSGRDHGLGEDAQRKMRQSKFRRGQAGGWTDVMPRRHSLLFLRRHGEMLRRLGYPTALHAEDLQPVALPRIAARRAARPRHVLLDGIKLADTRSDGIRRYSQGLMKALYAVAEERPESWRFSVRTVDRRIYDLREVADLLEPGQDIARAMEARAEASAEGLAHSAHVLRRKLHEAERLASERRLLRGVAHLTARRRRVDQAQFDLLHLFLPNVWSHYADVGLPRVTTVHDLSHVRCPETMPPDNIATLSAGLQSAAASGSQFIAVSDFTRREMAEVYDVSSDRLWVTLEGGDEQRFFPETRSADIQRVRSSYDLPNTPFFLALGTLEPRKNLMRTVRAFERVAAKFPDQALSFVIAGHTGWGSTEEWKQLEASPRVRVIGHVAEGDLAGLYSEAAAFCYVSHYEGFGLPPLEAMSCGTPVIYGDRSAMPEVVGHAGLPAAPHDEAAIADAIERLVRDPALRDSLGREAVMRARAFTWKRVAERTLQVYAYAIEQGVRPNTRSGSALGRARATASRLAGRAER